MKRNTAYILGAICLVLFFIIVGSTRSPISLIALAAGIVLFVTGSKSGKRKQTAGSSKHKTTTRNNASNLSIRTTQFNETLNILETTTNCDTFLGRMDFAFKIALETNSADWQNYLNNNAVPLTTEFIDRTIKNELAEINNLKTENGKKNRYDRFKDTMTSAFKSSDAFYAKILLGYLAEKLDAMDTAPSHTEAPIFSPEEYESRWKDGVSEETFSRFVRAIFLSNARRGLVLGNSPDDYPQYYKYDLDTPHPERLHKQLIAEGYLTYADTKTQLESRTIPEIKAILAEYSLPVSGKKARLVDTALSCIPVEELKSKLGETKLTMLTENGEELLSFAEGYAELFRCGWGISLGEYEKYRENGILNFSEAAEYILSERDKKPSFATKLYLAQLYYKNKDYPRSLAYYIQTMYFETCNYSHDNVIFAPANAARIHSMKEYFTEDMIAKCYTDNPRTRSSFSEKEFRDAVYAALNTD